MTLSQERAIRKNPRETLALIQQQTAKIDRLRTALRQADCPYKIDPDDGTVGSCVDNGHCGCCLGEPLMPRAHEGAGGGESEKGSDQ